jgi:thiol-disulfide isomerase/thioredoxin
VPGIAWFDGDVDAAFAAARASNKPVLIFWGAQWCPSCKQLKSSVFTRPDFIEKSRLFVPVYLDGDLPDAQKWGDAFRITGYPTLVILKPDQTEITRLAGGMDLALYARVLDGALGEVRPVKEIVDLAADGREAMTADDCRRLAYHAFDLEDDAVFDTARLASAFGGAARRCPADLVNERARFTFLAAGAVGRAEHDAIGGGAAPGAGYQQLIREVYALLADRETALANVDALAGLGTTFFVAARKAMPENIPALRERWTAIADAAGRDERFSPGDRLNAERLKVAAARGLAPDGEVPPAIAAAAVGRADEMLAAEKEPYVRGGLIVSALNLYLDLDDQPRMRALLEQEAATSKTPWYYLGHLAEVEELAGNKARAIELLAQAYAQSKGPASRFQWGYNYVSGLIRLTPGDVAGIEQAGLKVLGELSGPDSVHRRTRIRLGKLTTQLQQWNTTPERAAVVAKLTTALDGLQAGTS